MFMSAFQFISLFGLVILSLGFKAPFGKKFVYKYESQVATGVVDKVISQVAGFGLKATVAVQWQLERESVYFKLSHVEFTEFNKQTNNIFQHFANTTEIDEEVEEYIKELEQPFWISAGPKDTVNIEHGIGWEKTGNFKLSLAALFQIIVRRDSDVYIEMEEGITGRCPVIYRLTNGSDDPNARDTSLNISKVVLYDKCESRQHRLRFSISGYKCNQCDELTKPLETLGKTNYEIRVTRMDDESDSMSFEKIDANGAIIFTPFGPDGNTVLSLTNQTMTLVSVTDQLDEHYPQDLIAEPAVGFVFPRSLADPKALLEAESKLTDLIKVFATFDTQSISIMEFALLFRKFALNDFDYFFNTYVNLDINNSTVREGEIRIALLQALSTAGTEASAQYVMQLTSEKNISRHLAAELIRIVPFHLHRPSHQFLSEFSNFAHSYEINQFKDVLQEAVWLSLGTVIKKTCIVESISSIQTEKLDFARLKECNFYVESLVSDFRFSSDLQQQQMILRTIQNTNLPAVTSFSLSILKSDLETSLRRISIWGVMRLADKSKKFEVISALTEIAFNNRENFLLRLYVFEALIYINPTGEMVSLLVDHLSKEENEQISSYIYSTLVTMAKSSDPCAEKLTKFAKQALLYILPRRYDTLRYSKNNVLSYTNDKYKFGRSFQFAYIASNESLFPKEIYLGQSLKLFGHSFNFQDMIFHTGDADSYLSRYFHVFGDEGRGGSDDFVKRVDELLGDVKRGNVKEVPKFVFKYFGQDVSSGGAFGKDAAHCLYERNNWTKHDSTSQTDLLMRCIKFSFMDAQLTVPNDMGFLTTLQLHFPIVFKVGIRALANVTNPNITGDFHFKFGSNFMVKTSMFVESPLKRKYGYTLKTHAGMKVSVLINRAKLENMEFESEVKKFFSFLYYPTKGVFPASNPYTLVFFKTTPETFAHGNVLEYKSGDPERHFSYGQNFLGVGLTFNYTHNPLWTDLKSLFLKRTQENDYFEWPDKLFAAIMGSCDYLVLNPIGKPFHFSINYNHISTDHFAVDARLTRNVQPRGNKLEFQQNLSLDVEEKGEEVTNKWSYKHKSRSTENSEHLLIEFDNFLSNSTTSIRFELSRETDDFIQILIDPVSNPAKALRRFYNVSIKAGSSFQTHEWLKLDINGVGRRSESFKVDESLLRECRRDRDKGFEYSFTCWLLKKQRGRLHDFNFTVRQGEVARNVRIQFLRYFIRLLNTFDDEFEIEGNRITGDPNQTGVNFNFSNNSPRADVSISQSEETYKLSDIFIPHITVVESHAERLLENALHVHQPKCIMSGDYIQTTDRIIYQFPMGECYHVVFADCLTKRVIILMNQSPNNGKALRAIFSTHRIDVDSKSVEIDGIERLVEENWYIVYDNETSKEVLRVTKHLNHVNIDGFGVHVMFDGENAVISVTNWLRGLQCGLCGNFDGEKSNEFVRSDGMRTANATDFGQSYELRDENCIY